ncbi:MAG TPA: hypothetical protein VH277_20445 [Gemmatimonadaceae bacterium]|jgi:hypothetical protein|nr:hypothetical protein [Gemmatimonadaceae bacterium]
MATEEQDALRPKLARAQETLQMALDQACSADLGDADTGELIRLEEVLAIANEAAKEAVSVRRRLGRARPGSAEGHREIEDEKGVRWTVFAVYPSTTSGRAPLREPYTQGWLAFDSGLETRRLAPVPGDWLNLGEADLAAMCARAEISPRRKPRSETP